MFLDTNVLVRHLTGDPPAVAGRATAFLAGADRLFVTDVVIAELVCVLESFYECRDRDVSLSLTEATSAAAARRARLREIFGFDAHFRALGFDVQPVV